MKALIQVYFLFLAVFVLNAGAEEFKRGIDFRISPFFNPKWGMSKKREVNAIYCHFYNKSCYDFYKDLNKIKVRLDRNSRFVFYDTPIDGTEVDSSKEIVALNNLAYALLSRQRRLSRDKYQMILRIFDEVNKEKGRFNTRANIIDFANAIAAEKGWDSSVRSDLIRDIDVVWPNRKLQISEPVFIYRHKYLVSLKNYNRESLDTLLKFLDKDPS
ncbi:hypothetical protein [Pleionea sediminis]|uniref:hypothetical protein n=1 Tax=Pleionea sediminis TaxID=2569479 RepID=UPI0013DE5BD9|nr:hypothetical protein [Pleionea sediminis]